MDDPCQVCKKQDVIDRRVGSKITYLKAHMDDLPPSITDHIRYRTIHIDRETAAKKSRDAQRRYRNLTRNVVLSTLGAAICGGLLLYSVDLETNPANPHLLHALDDSPWQQILIVLQAHCLAAAAYAGYRLTFEDIKGRWRKERMQAEALRLERERAALELAHAAGPDTFRLAGTCFINFVEEQRAYLARRLDIADTRRGGLALVGSLAAGLIAAAGVLAGLTHALVLAFVGLVGVLAPAIAAAVQSWAEATSEQERLALHHHTAEQLGRILTDGETFNEAIASHDLTSAMIFAERAFTTLRLDHSGFSAILKGQED